MINLTPEQDAHRQKLHTFFNAIGKFSFQFSQLEAYLKIIWIRTTKINGKSISEDDYDSYMSDSSLEEVCKDLRKNIKRENLPDDLFALVDRFDRVHRQNRNMIYHSIWMIDIDHGLKARYVSKKNILSYPFQKSEDVTNATTAIVADQGPMSMYAASSILYRD